MIKFEYGKSYLWLFPIYGMLFFAGFAFCEELGNVSWSMLSMPVFFAILLIVEFRSGVAIDIMWRATHIKGSGEYRFALASHAAAVILFSVLSYLLIHSFGKR